MIRFRELDDATTYLEQLGSDDEGPVVLINVFHVAADDVDALEDAWSSDASFMAQQPGYVSAQLHRGVGASTMFVNVAEWRSAGDLRNAFSSPEFQARLQHYPPSTIASPHLFRRIAVPGICPG
jgi:heme-degrading monooxygenase HmoA